MKHAIADATDRQILMSAKGGLSRVESESDAGGYVITHTIMTVSSNQPGKFMGGVVIKMVFDITDRAFLDNLPSRLIYKSDDPGSPHSR